VIHIKGVDYNASKMLGYIWHLGVADPKAHRLPQDEINMTITGIVHQNVP
jgi:hypothetical protein